MSDFVQQNASSVDFASIDSESWVILSPIELSIKRKIEAVGIPLKDWNINIYRGVLTGFNEAFIISTDTRNGILRNCTTEDERKRTEELIRPILRGRDIKRYGYDWADLWLINTHNGIKGKLDRIHIENYPAVKAHLDQYWSKIATRADKGDTPYNLRNCAYLEDFSKPKLFYADITQKLSFALCPEIMFCNNTTYFIASRNLEELEHLQKYLNSPLIDWYYRTLSVQLGDSAVRMFSIYVLNIPIPLNRNMDIYQSYGLSADEIRFIETQ